MAINLTSNFFSNARGLTVADGGGVTWTFNKNTNTLAASVTGGPSWPINTGWGTPTGAAVVANFPGATATLLQASTALAEIIAILKSAGIIGA